MSLLVTTLAEQVYAYMYQHADADGFLNASAAELVVKLNAPCGRQTVLKAMQKLEREGRIYMISKGNGQNTGGPRWVVTEKALEDE